MPKFRFFCKPSLFFLIGVNELIFWAVGPREGGKQAVVGKLLLTGGRGVYKWGRGQTGIR